MEHGVFTALVFSTTGGMGREATGDWQMEFPSMSEKNTQSPWDGFAVVSLLQSSTLPSSVFMEVDPHVTAQSTS